MEKHVNIVGALHIGLSIAGMVLAMVIGLIIGLVGNFVDDPVAGRILPLVANIVVWVILLFSVPGIIAGIGLLKRKEWARILALVLSVIKLLNMPIGTAVGIYSIWVLVQDETVALFKPVIRRMD